MGQSQATPSKVDQALEKLTESERINLYKIFESHGGDHVGDEEYFKLLESHLQKYFSSLITARLVAAFRDHCNNVAVKASIRTRLFCEIIHLTRGFSQQTVEFVINSLQNKSNIVPYSSLKLFVSDLARCFHSLPTGEMLGASEQACDQFCQHIAGNKNDIECNLLVKKFSELSVATEMCQAVIKHVFYNSPLTTSKDMQGFMPVLVPQLELSARVSLNPQTTILSLLDAMYLNSSLPLNQQHKWRFLYSTALQGESFSKLSNSIVDTGPLLIVIRDQNGHVFGGYISTSLQYSSQFQGDEKSFVFGISPSYGIYTPSGYNKHFAYLNMGQETIPNGLAMGGQHNYFGWWLSTEFGKGHCKAKPTSTTFGSPQLSANEDFLIDAVEAWGIGDEPKLDEEEESECKSIIDKNPDMVAILRIAGKEPASEGYRESERSSTQPEVTELHSTHDPMD